MVLPAIAVALHARQTAAALPASKVSGPPQRAQVPAATGSAAASPAVDYA